MMSAWVRLEEIVIALKWRGMVAERAAAKRQFGQPVTLDHRRHRTVEDDDAFAQQMEERGRCRGRVSLHATSSPGRAGP